MYLKFPGLKARGFSRVLHVSRLLVHLVFVVKYRHAVISDSVWTSLRYGFDLSAKRLNLTLVELNHDKDHVHLF